MLPMNPDHVDLIEQIRAVIANAPSRHLLHLLASAYARNKDQAGLRKELFKGLELPPDHPMAGRVMALYAVSDANLKEAGKRIAELKKLQPDHPKVADIEGQLALKEKDYAKAVEVYDRLHKCFPENSSWVIGLAGAQWQTGKRDEHVAILSSWLKQNPQDVAAQFMLANSYLQLERNAEATAAFGRVVELAPNNAIVLNNWPGCCARKSRRRRWHMRKRHANWCPMMLG